MNELLISPIKVSIVRVDPREITQTFCYLGCIPAKISNPLKTNKADLKAHYGKNYREKLAMIASETYGLVSTHKQGSEMRNVKYVNNVDLFPEDSFGDIRDKIELSTGIPTYRQHIFYFDQGQYKTTYHVRLNGTYDRVNILKKQSDSLIGGIHVNNKYVKSSVSVDPLDHILQISAETIDDSHIFVVDLQNYMHSSINELIKDQYKFDLVYSGFILQFWPQFSAESFRDYISDESQLRDIYPNFAKNKIIMQSQYDAEREILNYNYKNSNKIGVWARDALVVRITRATVNVTTPLVQLNIRNTFDFLRLSPRIHELRATINHGGRTYMLRKSRGGNNIAFPSTPAFSSDLVVALAHGDNSQYIFVAVRKNGKIFIIGNWEETDDITAKDAVRILMKEANFIISEINALGKYAFIMGTSISAATKEVSELSDVESIILWKKSMGNLLFTQLIKKMELLQKSNILIIKGNIKSGGETDYLIRKGAHNYTLNLIKQTFERINVPAQNMYIYFSNATAHKKWANYANGRSLHIKHRATAIAFKIISVGKDEFDTFYRIISSYLYQVLNKMQFNDDIVKLSTKNFYKTHKLSQDDPELYNIKVNEGDMVYSRLCQLHKQPIIYNALEIKNIPKKDFDKLTKYWNFTEKKPAYYACPNPEYPDISFITGKHPNGYCLPCCSKQTMDDVNSKKSDKLTQCIATRTYTEDTQEIRKYVMKFGKTIPVNRISSLPVLCEKLLYNMDSSNLRIFGVDQQLGSIKCGAFQSMCAALKISVKDMTDLIRKVISNERLFGTLLGGEILVYFADQSYLDVAINDIIILNRVSTSNFNRWNELMLELISLATNTIIYVFAVTENIIQDKSSNMNYSVNLTKSRNINGEKTAIIIALDNFYYPVFDIISDEYYANDHVRRRVYQNDDAVSMRLAEVYGVEPKVTYVGWSILAQYINKSGFCYAKIYKNSSGDKVYMPTKYEIPQINVTQIYTVFDRTGFSASALREMIGKTNIKEYMTHDGRVIGAVSNAGFHHIDDVIAPDQEPSREIGYDPIVVNELILNNTPGIDDIQPKLSPALYVNYQYRLFVSEFANYISAERNNVIREAIYKAIRATNFSKPIGDLHKQIKVIITGDISEENTPDNLRADLSDIHNLTWSHYYRKINKESLIDQINKNVYSFDRYTINKLIALDKSGIIAKLREIVPNFAINAEFAETGESFPNVYVPCAVENKVMCVKNKLIVSDISEMIDFLASDLSNPLKQQYFLNDVFVENYIDYFDFTSAPNEIIQIFQ